VDQRQISRSKKSQILAVLLVNPLDILRNHHPDASTHFGVRRLFPAGTFAATLATDCRHESTALYIAASNRSNSTALQSEIRNFAQGFIEIKAIVCGRDFVGGNIITQLRVVGWILRVPSQIFASQLAFDKFRIFGKKKNAA
jgi:hypothetical protein